LAGKIELCCHTSTMMKSKKKMKHKPRRPIVPKWKLFRSSDPFLSVFMWGINHTLIILIANNGWLTFAQNLCTRFVEWSYKHYYELLLLQITESSHIPPTRLLMPDDFKAFSKIRIDNHLFNKESMPSHFKVKEYCPNVFRSIREKFAIDDDDYLKSLTKHEPVVMEPSGRGGGARVFVSYDKRFLIKTLCAEEVAEVHSILQKYHNYIVEHHSKTLLPQFLGMYRLTVEGAETYVVVTRSIFSRNYAITKKYDLKGSTVQRQASDKEKAKDFPTFKDKDFLEEKCRLYLSADSRQKLMSMLTSDTEFLASLNLMDYSLLVGLHVCDQEQQQLAPNSPRRTVAEAVHSSGVCPDSSELENASDGSNEYGSQPTPPESPEPSSGAFAPFSDYPELKLDDEFYAVTATPDAPKKMIYFIGLIDILTYYGMKKLTATAAKTVKYGAEAEISSVRPQQYAKRLVEFVSRAFADTAASPPNSTETAA
ncbi:Phosphatidylinositol 5-phosphate 4-kinase type-2 beta, partial [Trichinella sp. T6]